MKKSIFRTIGALALALLIFMQLMPFQGASAVVEAKEEFSSATQNLLDGMIVEENRIEPALEEPELEADLSNVMWSDWVKESPETMELLLKNRFVVLQRSSRHFADIYEMNRYRMAPNFVTTDSLLHTYHLYFNFLLKQTEKSFLITELKEMLVSLSETVASQQFLLRGSEFEEAGKLELAAMTVALSLLGGEVEVSEELAETVEKELQYIRQADGIHQSDLMGDEDYSQYTPRGHYAGDPELEAYFRTVMFLGRLNLKFSEDRSARAAALLTLALAENEEALESWEKLYQVTRFFAGESDDHGFYELYPLLEEVYGDSAGTVELLSLADEWPVFLEYLKNLPPPSINSIVRHEYLPEEDKVANGFRLMGQRFNWDAAIFQKLIYSDVEENPQKERRYLPDVLDVPAVYGSEVAARLLEERSAFEYSKYMENMTELQENLTAAGDSAWTASLSSAWQYCLLPLLESKRGGYPAYMQSDAWDRKKLECFAGSYMELKHDTVLYAKQAMAEFGGAAFDQKPDDRGYVETEPEVFGRLAQLAEVTSAGLKKLKILEPEDEKNLAIFVDLARRLKVIAEKELRGELPTEEEFELIRSIGGQLEHLYIETFRNQDEFLTDYPPAALVTDIATDPNGQILHIANGNPQVMYVVVEVDGQLRLASGPVYDFYQFAIPSMTRLTDKQWQIQIGAEHNFEEIELPADLEVPEKPDWTQDYRQGVIRPDAGLGGIPAWVEWSSGEIALADGNGFGRLYDQNFEYFRNGVLQWRSPAEFLVQDFQFCDFDRDGAEECALLLWKVGRYGTSRPFGLVKMS